VSGQLRRRLDAGLGRIAFFVVPSAVAFLALGDVIAAALFQTGKFQATDARYVWGILAGSAVGLLAQTLSRLYSSAYYALRDTRTPLRYAIIRVSLSAVLSYLFAIRAPVWIGIDPLWGVAGLTVSAGLSGWVELLLLRRTLNRRIGATGIPPWLSFKLWTSALLSAAVAWGIKSVIGAQPPILAAAAILGPYGAVYLGATRLWRVTPSNRGTPPRSPSAPRA
jgi:putative peptidoglycan lipid II flippase